MKFSKLLVLTALWLGASSAMATIVDGVRQKPAPTATQGFVASESTDTYYYLYNVDAKAFFTEGNAWGTQVSLGEKGLKVAFTPDAAYDAAYLFNDFSIAKNAWKNVFFDNENQMFVDLGSQANYRWGVKENGETFRLFAADEANGNPGWDPTTNEETGETTEHPAYREGMFMGWKVGSSSTACVPYLEEAEGNCINWAFVTEEVYKAYASEVDVYVAAEALRALIEEVKAGGYTETAAYEAIYANEAATKAELEKAAEDLKAAFVEWGKGHASVDNPADMTSKIVNPHFDNADCKTGWSGDEFGRGGTVSDGAEHYSKNYDTYQKVTGLAPGIYSVGVNGYYRAGNYGGDAENHWLANDAASKYAKLYAKVGDNYYETPLANVMSGAQTTDPGAMAVTYTDPETQEEVTVYVPNTMAQADVYFHSLNQYANKLYVAVDEAGELTLGVKKTSQIGGDWSMFDDFSLLFYGTGSDAAKLFLDETLKNYSEKTIEEGTIYTESYLTAYNEALHSEFNVESLEDVNKALATLAAANDAIDKNIKLWKDWQADCAAAFKKYVLDDKYAEFDEIADLADYVDADGDFYQGILEAHELTNEQLEEEIAKIAAMCKALDDALKNSVHHDGEDMTQFITNPGFDDDKDIDFDGAVGWTIDRASGGNVVRGPLGAENKKLMEDALGYMNYCFESWHCHKWDIWQEIKDLPKGMYQLDVQGYVRCEVGGYNRGDDIEPNYPSPVYLYMNSAMSSFPSVYSQIPAEFEGGHEFTTVESWTTETINGNNFPNSMGGAAQCFGWGMYKTTAYGLIAKKGDTFRIGVKMDANQDWWCIFDNFKLTYREPSVEVVKPILEAELEKFDLSKPMGKDVAEKVEALKAAAAEAIAAGDADKMFDALVECYDLSEAIINSTALFAKLNTANEELAGTILASTAAAETISEANALNTKIQSGIDNHEFEDAEVEGLMHDIDVMITKLGIPADADTASDENPVDMTTAIKNPSYDENNSGWSGSSAAYNGDATNVEIFGTNFDYYQDLEGLPAGTYQLGVTGFYRAGSAGDDYKAWVANPDSLNYAYIYAMTSLNNDTVWASKSLKRLGSEAKEDLDQENYVVVAEATDDANALVVCNTMVTAGYEFEDMKYINDGPIFVLPEGAKLRIGLKKDQNLENNWTIWDNWKLTYFGKSSAKKADDNSAGIRDLNEVATLKIEYFTLDGRKANASQKGIIIQKVTLGNGNVVVKKVRK